MNPSPLLVQRLTRWICNTYRKIQVPFLSSLIFGFLAYTFAFTNKLLNHDEAGQLFDKGEGLTSGRWGLSILERILPNYSMPWLYGVMTVVLITLAICILVRMFAIRSRLIQVLLSGSILVFPSVIGLFGYMFTSSSYAVAILMTIGAVWCIRQKHILFIIPALGMMIFSLGIYQSYISIAASLLLVCLVQDLLQDTAAKTVLHRGIFYVLFLLLSLVGYYLALQCLLWLMHAQLNTYATNATTFDLDAIIQGLLTAYHTFFQYFTIRTRALVPTSLSGIAHLTLGVTCSMLLLINLRSQKRNFGQLLLFVLIIVLLPLAINCMFLISPADSVHTLVLYSFVSLYVLAAVILDHTLCYVEAGKLAESCRRIGLNLALTSLAVILGVNIYISNVCYLNLHLRYENSYAFYTALLAQIQQMPEFQAGTQLAVVGDYDHPDFYAEKFPFQGELTGIKGFLPDSYSYGSFLRYYIGLSIPIAPDETIAHIQQTEQFQDMPVYPYYGSTAVFGDTIVIKLS